MLALALSVSITFTSQKWVGGTSIYAPELEEKREVMHTAILYNELPDSVESWSSLGSNGLNARVLTVWIAEGIHQVAGLPIHRSYLVLETAALLLCCLLLYAFLEPYTGWPFALGGLLYWGSILSLTYANHHFHPWDKPSIALWLLALICTRQRRWWSLAAVLVVGVITKYDILVFPALVFLAYRRSEPWKTNVLRTAGLLALTVSTFLVLRWLVPGGFEQRDVVRQVMTNLMVIRDGWYFYPPFLAFGIPAVLAAMGYSIADPFAKGCIQLAVLVGLILFLQTNFVEVRAEVPLLLLLLPSAWYGLLRLAATPAVRQIRDRR